jgi:hypothetical protein
MLAQKLREINKLSDEKAVTKEKLTETELSK